MPRAGMARLRAKPREERRIAIVVARDEGVSPAATLLAMLYDAGYRVENAPADGDALASRLRAEPEETLSFATYSAVFATLPMPLQRQVSGQWGAGERDPLFRPGRLDCGRFMIPAVRCGNIAVVLVPPQGSAVPRHSHLAAYAWLSDEFRADAVIDLGGVDAGVAEAVLGSVPRLVAPVEGEIGGRVLGAIESDER